MKIVILDAQGGGMGRQLVEGLKKALPNQPLIAVGTNALATAAMLRAGADQVATGENAVVVCARDGGFDSLPDWHGAVRRDAGRSDREHGAGGRAQQGAQDSAAGEPVSGKCCWRSENVDGRGCRQGGGRNRGAGFGGFHLKRN